MTSKSTTKKRTAGDTPAGHDSLDQLYVAHQVHTLAQIVWRQIAQQQRVAAAAPAGVAFGGPPVWPTPMATAPQGPPFPAGPLVYWYP